MDIHTIWWLNPALILVAGAPLLNSALGDFDHSDRSAIEGQAAQSVFHLYLQHYSCFIGVRQSKSPSRCKSWLKVEIIADN